MLNRALWPDGNQLDSFWTVVDVMRLAIGDGVEADLCERPSPSPGLKDWDNS